MMNNELEQLLTPVRNIAVAAGVEILKIYNTTFDVVEKTDGSPLTTADSRAHDIISSRLRELTPSIPVLSEESATNTFETRRQWNQFWLVDPLDGTREFVNRNGEFTVNIALVENSQPVLGVVHTPVSGITHQGARGSGAQRVRDEVVEPINCRNFNRSSVCLVASRSHSGPEVAEYQRALESDVEHVETASMGSALKICLVAEGSADIYPRLGPTSEWDTAASHCVLLEAGGRLCDTSGNELVYNKTSLLNPWFLAIGDTSHDWLQYLRRH
jgi:3'(2'), 5'-bisphosphate nucleotidase